MAESGVQTTEIPRIDLGDLRDIDDFRQAAIDNKQLLGRAVVDAFHNVGFAFIRAPRDLNEKLDDMYNEWQKVHIDMSEKAKQNWWGGHHKFQRGWTGVDTELALYCKRSLINELDGSQSRQAVFNHVENWFFAPEGMTTGSSDREADINFLPNVWPSKSDLPSLVETDGELLLRKATSGVHKDLLALDASVMATTEPHLGLDDGYFAYRNDPDHSPSLLRELYYHPVHQTDFERGAVKGACQHTDICDRTWLPRSRSFGPGKGLEVRTRNQEWISGKAPEGYVIAQVGDMLQHTTGDYFLSAQHRVEPPFLEAGNALGRLSCALFIHPRPNTDLGEQFTRIKTQDGGFYIPKYYGHTSANDKLITRLDAIFE